MKIVVTGALGHIGSRVVRDLGTRWPDAEIVLMDNMSTSRYCSLFNLPEQPTYTLADVDVRTPAAAPFFEGATAVVHLAAITDATASFDRAHEVEANNYEATRAVAALAADAGAGMIHLSSTSVYGTQEAQVDEDCGAHELAPQSPYAETKLKEEAWLRDNAGGLGLRFVTCRFGTIAGVSPGMRFHTAVNKFCFQAAFGRPITVWRTALHQKRPYLELGDASRAIQFLLTSEVFDGRIYNVLTANHTVHDIVEAIRQVQPAVQVKLVEERIMNQLSYEVLDRRVRERGFAPSGSIRAAIHETLALLGNHAGREAGVTA
jgi:UDP-glucose 4-epimerase